VALVSQQVMDETWPAVAQVSPATILTMQREWRKAQKHLAAFIMETSLPLGDHTAGLALYIHLVSYQAFLRSGARFRKITRDTVEQLSRKTAARIEALRAQPAPLDALPAAFATEPTVLAYTIEALLEPPDDAPGDLSEEAFWQVLHLLATAAECLHEAGEPPAAGVFFTP